MDSALGMCHLARRCRKMIEKNQKMGVSEAETKEAALSPPPLQYGRKWLPPGWTYGLDVK
jgi:hypothetical protein